MRCPNCGASSETVDCIECGRSVPLTIQIINNAIRFYNEALVKISMKDLSGAIDLCEKSISLDKNNAEARNLLGLLNYKKGAVGEALKHWTISSNIDINKTNKAFYYLEDYRNNSHQYNKMNDAVALYNQAIYYLKTKNDDLAVIRLKKALDTNPTFIDAMNLLAFCYILQKNYGNASKLVDIVLKIDANNYLAKKYSLELLQTKSKRNFDENIVSNYQYNGKSMKDGNEKSFTDDDRLQFSKIISFIFGILVSGAVLCAGGFFLYVKTQAEIQIIQEENEAILKTIQDKDTYISNVQDNFVALEDELQIYMKKDLINQNKDRLLHSETLYLKTQLEDAKVIFSMIDYDGFDESCMIRYYELKEKLGII